MLLEAFCRNWRLFKKQGLCQSKSKSTKAVVFDPSEIKVVGKEERKTYITKRNSMKKFSEWLEEKNPEIFSEILGTLALATALGAAVAPKTTRKVLGYIGSKAGDVAGHVVKTGVNLGLSAVGATADLAGQAVAGGARGAMGTAKGWIAARKKEREEKAERSEVKPGSGVSYA